MDRDTQDLIGATYDSVSVEDVHQVCTQICRTFGFDHFIYGARFPSSFVQPFVLIVSGYPPQWREHYNQCGYIRLDPTLPHVARTVRPLRWEEITTTQSDNEAVCRFMNEARDFGLRSGITIPLRGAEGEVGMLSLTSELDFAKSRERFDRALPSVHLLSTYIHEAACRVIKTGNYKLPAVELSRRERECLLWSAEGKTAWEISRILGISERTVVYHLQRCNQKLNASSRQQAVARAIARGILAPEVH